MNAVRYHEPITLLCFRVAGAKYRIKFVAMKRLSFILLLSLKAMMEEGMSNPTLPADFTPNDVDSQVKSIAIAYIGVAVDSTTDITGSIVVVSFVVRH